MSNKEKCEPDLPMSVEAVVDAATLLADDDLVARLKQYPHWPQNSTKIHEIARAWVATADLVGKADEYLSEAEGKLQGNWTGDAYDQFAGYMKKVHNDHNDHIAAMRLVGQSLTDLDKVIDECKTKAQKAVAEAAVALAEFDKTFGTGLSIAGGGLAALIPTATTPMVFGSALMVAGGGVTIIAGIATVLYELKGKFEEIDNLIEEAVTGAAKALSKAASEVAGLRIRGTFGDKMVQAEYWLVDPPDGQFRVEAPEVPGGSNNGIKRDVIDDYVKFDLSDDKMTKFLSQHGATSKAEDKDAAGGYLDAADQLEKEADDIDVELKMDGDPPKSLETNEVPEHPPPPGGPWDHFPVPPGQET